MWTRMRPLPRDHPGAVRCVGGQGMTGRGGGGADGDRDSPVRGDGGGRQSRRADKYPLASQLGGRRVEFGKMEISLLSPSCSIPRLARPLVTATHQQSNICLRLSSSTPGIDPSAAAPRSGLTAARRWANTSVVAPWFIAAFYPAAAAPCCITKPLYERWQCCSCRCRPARARP